MGMCSNANQNGIVFVNILIISVTLIVVAVPEGLCLGRRLLSLPFIHVYQVCLWRLRLPWLSRRNE